MKAQEMFEKLGYMRTFRGISTYNCAKIEKGNTKETQMIKQEYPQIIEGICKKCKYYIEKECDGDCFEELNGS